MNNTSFDVMIVYSEQEALSADTLSEDVTVPFANSSQKELYNTVYGYFLNVCRKYNVKAAFATSADIIGAGKFSSYWLFENDTWIKTRNYGFSNIIFDKFAPNTRRIKKRRDLLFSSDSVKPFNDPYLFSLFFDKQKTFNKFSTYSIPTVSIIKSNIYEIKNALAALKKIISIHPHRNDFSNEIIVKDRFGSGGENVFKCQKADTKKIYHIVKTHPTKSFVIQPFITFNAGFIHKNIPTPTDIRVIFLGEKIVQTYIRVAKAGEFICNEHQGGCLTYIAKNKMPKKVLVIAKEIAYQLRKKSSLFSLDFIISNNGNVYLLEANTGPGLDWNHSLKENEIEAKKLIDIIVKEINHRNNASNYALQRNN
jgi:glutathione synthase/RimK-type ligase-like ATP-grasp enzyme